MMFPSPGNCKATSRHLRPMSSPYTRYANITVLFQLPTGAETTSMLGNPALDAQPLIVIAWGNRRKQRDQRSNEPLQDGELSRLYYKGFWVHPFPWAPQALQAEQIGKAYVWRTEPGRFGLPEEAWPDVPSYETFIQDNANRIVAEGDFVLEPSPAGPYGVEAKTGDVFSGYLLTQVAWGDAI